MTGDTNAVTVLEMAHRRQFTDAGVLRTDTLLVPECPLPRKSEFGDVFIDDSVLFLRTARTQALYTGGSRAGHVRAAVHANCPV